MQLILLSVSCFSLVSSSKAVWAYPLPSWPCLFFLGTCFSIVSFSSDVLQFAQWLHSGVKQPALCKASLAVNLVGCEYS